VGGFAIPNGSSPNCQFTTGSLGGAGQSDAAGLWQTNPFIQGNYGSNLADGVTFRCLFMPTSAFGGTYTTLFGDGNNLRTLFNGSQQLQAVAMAATFHDSILLGNFTVNAVHDFVITNATSGLTTYYQNGTALGSNTIALMNNIAITVSFFAGDNTRMVGIVFLFQVWKRLLSAAEIAYLYTDPFAMIVPVEPEMMIMNPPPAVLYAYTLMGQIVF
jgi:hypothetical protein